MKLVYRVVSDDGMNIDRTHDDISDGKIYSGTKQ